MFKFMLRQFAMMCLVLSACLQPGLYAFPPDSAGVFFRDRTFNRFLDKAIMYQQKADSLHMRTIAWRKEAQKMYDCAQRSALQQKIMQVEDSTEFYREMAREYFAYLNGLVPQKTARSPCLEKDTVLHGITVYQYRLTDEFLEKLNHIDEAMPSPGASGEKPAGPAINFRIYKQSPYSAAQAFEHDFPLPAGVFYRIQLAVYKNPLAPDHFGGLAPITTEKIPGKDLTRYFVGKFYRLGDAKDALRKVRAYDHPDAFIIGYYNGKRGTFDKLQELERQP